MNLFRESLFKIEQKISKKTKIIIPILIIYLILVLTTIVPLPSYILFGIATLTTFTAYLFIKYILDLEENILKEHKRKVNHFQEIFNQVSEENKKLNGELEQMFNDFDEHVISSKTDLFGKITYASKAFQRISGYSEEELVGKSHNIIRHPDMPKEAFADMWNTIEENRIWSGEVKNLKKDGNFYWTRAIISPVYDFDNAKIGYNAIRQDITKEKIK